MTEQIYLTRRNLQTLLNKLDRTAKARTTTPTGTHHHEHRLLLRSR